MLRWRPIILLAVPTVLIGATSVLTGVQTDAALEGLVEPEAMDWTLQGKPANLSMQRRQEGEVVHYEIQVRSGDVTIETVDFSIDRDLFGGGFVGGLDLDGDGQPELVLADRRGPAASRMLQPGTESVVMHSFKDLPEEYWQRIKPRLDRVVPSGYAMMTVALGMIWLLIGVLFYAVLLLWTGLKALRRR